MKLETLNWFSVSYCSLLLIIMMALGLLLFCLDNPSPAQFENQKPRWLANGEVRNTIAKKFLLAVVVACFAVAVVWPYLFWSQYIAPAPIRIFVRTATNRGFLFLWICHLCATVLFSKQQPRSPMSTWTFWQEFFVTTTLLSFIVCLDAGQYLIKCNEVTGFIRTSKSNIKYAKTWLEQHGGYSGYAHFASFLVTLLSLIYSLLMGAYFYFRPWKTSWSTLAV